MAVGIREMTELEVAGASADADQVFRRPADREGHPRGDACRAGWPATWMRCALSPTCRSPSIPPARWRRPSTWPRGSRGMERGSVSMDRDAEGNDVPSDMELVRLAVPRRVYTMSHYQYVADRLKWLYDHREMVGGLEFCEEPPVLRFFAGKMIAKGGWGAKLAAAFEKDFGPAC